MRYVFVLITCVLLLTQCRTPVDVQPTGTYDTLGITWMTIERNNVLYYFQGSGIKGASVFTDIFEEAYAELDPVFKAVLPQKLRFFVWTDWEQAEYLLGNPLSFAVGAHCECHVTVSHPLGHEVAHILSYWSGGTPRLTYSKFISEGVAVAFDLEDYNKLEVAKEVLNAYKLNSVAELWEDGKGTAPDELLYPVAGAFVEYLYRQNAPAEFFELIKKQTRAEAEAIYGKNRLDELIRHFDSKLGL